MILSISSMSARPCPRAPARRACRPRSPGAAGPAGVRRSCDTPASSSARSCSAWRRLASIWLKPRLRVTISDGPCLRQRRRRPALADVGDGVVQLAQRSGQVAREHIGADQQHGQRDQAPFRPRATGPSSDGRGGSGYPAQYARSPACILIHSNCWRGCMRNSVSRAELGSQPIPQLDQQRVLRRRADESRARPSRTMRAPYSSPSRVSVSLRRAGRSPPAPRAAPAAARPWCR